MNELLIDLVFGFAGFCALVFWLPGATWPQDMAQGYGPRIGPKDMGKGYGQRIWARHGRGNAGVNRMPSRERMFRRAAATVLPALMALAAAPVRAGDCAFEPQGEGHVIDMTD